MVEESLREEEGKPVLARYSIPLGGSEATLIFTGSSLLPEDFDALSDYIQLFKKQFERRAKAPEFPKQAIYNQEGHGKRPITLHRCFLKDGEKFYCDEHGTLIPERLLEFQ